MGLPINLPRRLVKNKSAFTAEWGNSIREAIWRLSKQKPPAQLAPGAGSTHPWAATTQGDDKINIGAGEIMGVRAPAIPAVSPDFVPLYMVPISYAGGEIEVTAETGYIYAVATVVESVIHWDTQDLGFVSTRTQSRKTTSITAQFHEDPPATIAAGSNNEVWIPICEVSKTDDVATVEKQHLMHNPILTIEIAENV